MLEDDPQFVRQYGYYLIRRCGNPQCSEKVQWSGKRGRPPLFCSSSCRKRTVTAAARLEQEVADLDQQIAHPGAAYRSRRELEATRAKLQWLLGAFPESVRSDLTPARSHNPTELERLT